MVMNIAKFYKIIFNVFIFAINHSKIIITNILQHKKPTTSQRNYYLALFTRTF